MLAGYVSVRVLVVSPLAAVVSYGWFWQLPQLLSLNCCSTCLWLYSVLLCFRTPVFGY